MRITRLLGALALSTGGLAAPLIANEVPSPSGPVVEPVLPEGVQTDWWSQVQSHLQEREYHAGSVAQTPFGDLESALQAPNRAQNLRTYFTPEGVRLVRRTETDPTWHLGMNLTGIGRGDLVSTPPAADLTSNGNRVRYDRGDLVEWYVNDPNGLEQGFTLAKRPEGADADALRMEMELTGDLTAVVSESGSQVEFSTAGGVTVLHLSKLIAWDASDRTLPARFEHKGKHLSLIVDDKAAIYPIVIDPLATSPNWTAEGNQSGAQFGASATTAGDVNGDGYSDVIVGAWSYDNGQTDEGRVFAFHGSPAGLSFGANWSAEGNQTGARFGTSVSTAGDVNGDGYSDVIVGANKFSSGQTEEGRAFVYIGSPSGLFSSPSWTGESDQAFAEYGTSVSTAGDVNGDGYSDVIVGAIKYDDSFTDQGRAYVYHGSSGGLFTVAAWTRSGLGGGGNFGQSVSTAGDLNGDGYAEVIIGAPSQDSPGNSGTGLARVYSGSSTGLGLIPKWSQFGYQASGSNGISAFGSSVSTAGDVNGDGYADFIVGASSASNGQTNEGRAYAYYGKVTIASIAAPAWIAESDEANAFFGISVSTAGDVNGDGYGDVIVGASFFGSPIDQGRAFVYNGSPAGLQSSPSWDETTSQPNTRFGQSVSTAGDVNGDGFSDVIVGAPAYDNGQSDEGRTFVYHGASSGLATVPSWAEGSDQTNAQLGTSVSTAGDVDGDGYDDVIVGAPLYDGGGVDSGRAFAYNGSSVGLLSVPSWTGGGSAATGSQFGYSVSTAGDVNGDGYDDVIVGIPFNDNGHADEGRVEVYHGSSSGLSLFDNGIHEGNQTSAFFGISVSTAGDVNGDGYADVIVGADKYDNGQTDEGRAFVYHGSAEGIGYFVSTPAAWTAEGNQTGARFGFSVSTAGDVNGDGYSDVIVGAPWAKFTESGEGRAYVYHGSSTGLAAAAAWVKASGQPNGRFGYSVSSTGDVNGDGFADVIVGAPLMGSFSSGKAFVYPGSVTGVAMGATWTGSGTQNSENLGLSVSTAGDVNGDGYADVIVGAPLYDNGQTNEGRSLVYHGSSTGLGAAPSWTKEGDQSSAWFGRSVATAGDVNGDGYSDVIVGAPFYDAGQTDEGVAFLYMGNGDLGVPVRPQQERQDGTPIAHLGRATGGEFTVSALGRSPFGRGFVSLETEVKPLGVPFNGSGTEMTPFANSSLTGVNLQQPLSGLAPATSFHWRARFLYDPATSPYQSASRWFSPHGNGFEEADIRTTPCNGAAQAVAYGTGKPGTSGVPVLSSTVPPSLGETADLTITNVLPGVHPVVQFFGLNPTIIPFDGGTLLVSPLIISSFSLPFDASGKFSLPVEIPFDSALCGLDLYFQFMIVDPGAAGFYQTAQTNGLHWTAGW